MKDKQFWIGAGIVIALLMVYYLIGHPFFLSNRTVMLFAILLFSGTL
ncbi:MAG: hypothetical protein HOH91_02500, partial [Candidatus Marinimicrobia bacterium]|nr:hypothetical protein [Candidatus Neomarinimicrobiota bacterium]